MLDMPHESRSCDMTSDPRAEMSAAKRQRLPAQGLRPLFRNEVLTCWLAAAGGPSCLIRLLTVCARWRQLLTDEHNWRLTAFMHLKDWRFGGSWLSTVSAECGRAVQVRPAAVIALLPSTDRCTEGPVALRDGKLLWWSEFVERFDGPGRPVLLSGLMEGWAASTRWTYQYLIEASEGHLCNFLEYSTAAAHAEREPLYIFEDKVPAALLADWTVPCFFREDLWKHVPGRPPWRWLLIGPAGSGTPFHVDPLGTSAWNALVSGRKRMAPGAREWLQVNLGQLKHHQLPDFQFDQLPGQTVFVPRGWWHLVLNVEDSVAVTQNLTNKQNVRDSLQSVKSADMEDVYAQLVVANAMFGSNLNQAE